ncbi:ATP-binding protein [Sphingomonas sp. CJ20]
MTAQHRLQELQRSGQILQQINGLAAFVKHGLVCETGRRETRNAEPGVALESLRHLAGLDARRSAAIRMLSAQFRSHDCSAEGRRRIASSIEQFITEENNVNARLHEDIRKGVVAQRWISNAAISLAGVFLIFAASVIFKMSRKALLLRKFYEAERVRQYNLFRSSAGAMVIASNTGLIREINGSASSLFLLSKDQAKGRDIRGILTDLRSVEEDEMRATGEIFLSPGSYELTCRRSDKTFFLAEVSVASIQLSDGDSLLFSIRNISALSESDQQTRDAVTTISHELRTPLSAISGALEIVLGGDTGAIDDDTREMVTIASKNVSRVIHLVEDILDVERLKAGRTQLLFQEVDVGKLVLEVVNELGPIAGDRGINMDIEKGDRLVAVIDDRRLSQVLVNILANAFKFSPPDGFITIRIRRHGRVLSLDVMDEGPGVSSDFRERLFTRFERDEGSVAGRVQGSGLGLAISREIMEKMGGKLVYHPNVPTGARFTISLPLAPDHLGGRHPFSDRT